MIPKGNPSSSSPHADAALEAEEEAGVRGAVCPTPLGSYRYRKRRSTGASLMFDVEVYPLAVTQELTAWKESHERERRCHGTRRYVIPALGPGNAWGTSGRDGGRAERVRPRTVPRG